MLLKGKGYYTLGIYPMMIAAGGVAFDTWLRNRIARVVLPLFLVLMTIPVVPIGLPVLNKEGLKTYFKVLDEKYGIDLGRRFEDGTIHSLPQDYADMIGWEELTILADSAYSMIGDKQAAFIYGENYGHAGAITVIGKKYGLPEAVSFHESFSYWFPREFPVEIKSMVYINGEMGDDVRALFGKITLVGAVSDPDAREYGTVCLPVRRACYKLQCLLGRKNKGYPINNERKTINALLHAPCSVLHANITAYLSIALRFSSGGIFSMAYLSAVRGMTALFFMTKSKTSF